jgi:hypothetical protein
LPPIDLEKETKDMFNPPTQTIHEIVRDTIEEVAAAALHDEAAELDHAEMLEAQSLARATGPNFDFNF